MIREAREDELDAVADLMLRAYAQYFPPAPRHRDWEDYMQNVADVRSRLDRSELLVAERDGALAGAVTYFPDAHASEDVFPAGWASFRLLAVDPAHRGAGIGRMLTEECIRRARDAGASALGIHTADIMAVAKGMYERMGFERMPEADVPVLDGELIILAYRLDLAGA